MSFKDKIRAYEMLITILPKQCALCDRVLNKEDLENQEIIGNLDPRFQFVTCTSHYFVGDSADGNFAPDYQQNMTKLAFLMAREINRAEGKLRGHEPELIEDNKIRCTQCGKTYLNFPLMTLITCKFKGRTND